jgi:hypothetical protein
MSYSVYLEDPDGRSNDLLVRDGLEFDEAEKIAKDINATANSDDPWAYLLEERDGGDEEFDARNDYFNREVIPGGSWVSPLDYK